MIHSVTYVIEQPLTLTNDFVIYPIGGSEVQTPCDHGADMLTT